MQDVSLQRLLRLIVTRLLRNKTTAIFNPEVGLWQCAGRNPRLLVVAAEPVPVRCLGRSRCDRAASSANTSLRPLARANSPGNSRLHRHKCNYRQLRPGCQGLENNRRTRPGRAGLRHPGGCLAIPLPDRRRPGVAWRDVARPRHVFARRYGLSRVAGHLAGKERAITAPRLRRRGRRRGRRGCPFRWR